MVKRANPTANEANTKPEKPKTSKPSRAKIKSTVSPVAPRPSAEAVAASVAPVEKELASIPAKIEPQPKAPIQTAAPAKRETPMQINFKASPQFARLISDLSQEAGGTRVMFAKLLKAAGHVVPEQDLEVKPFGARRTWE